MGMNVVKGIAIDMSRLAEVADEVSKTKRPQTIGISQDVVAVLRPVTRRAVRRARQEPTAEDIAAFEAAAGGLEDVDTDQFLQDSYENRRISTRPPVEL